MRPGHLNVFDGLRITTEHMNYLQGSFHSAVQDLRGILGLGAVHEGFGVAVEGNSVTVGPGLAFDHQRNRIVLDMPVTLELNFAPGENTKYVCIKYDQIEDGEVEGRFTLVWDSCGVVLEPALPDAADNLVAIARVDRVGGNGVIEVTRIPPAAENKTEATPETIAEKPTESITETPSPAPGPVETIRTVVKQGVTRLSNTLAEATVSLDFEPLGLTCQTILTATARKANGDDAKPHTCSINAQGEVTFGTDGVSQFGVVRSKLIEDGIACLPLKLAYDSEAEKKDDNYAGPRALELLVKTNKSDGKGFVISGSVNRNEMTAEEIKKIEDEGYVFEWEALVAWKALGESRG